MQGCEALWRCAMVGASRTQAGSRLRLNDAVVFGEQRDGALSFTVPAEADRAKITYDKGGYHT